MDCGGKVGHIFDTICIMHIKPDIYNYVISDKYGNEGNFHTADMKEMVNVSGIMVLLRSL